MRILIIIILAFSLNGCASLGTGTGGTYTCTGETPASDVYQVINRELTLGGFNVTSFQSDYIGTSWESGEDGQTMLEFFIRSTSPGFRRVTMRASSRTDDGYVPTLGSTEAEASQIFGLVAQNTSMSDVRCQE
jgi:hypothetical protein